MPLEHFLICPPLLVDGEALGLSERGVTLHEIDGVTHVFDIVGRKHYPNVADVIEETRRMGASRRIARTADFGRLTAESRLILLHQHASIDNAVDLWKAFVDESTEYTQPTMKDWPIHGCPQHHDHSALPASPLHNTAMCQALYYQDVTGGDALYDPTQPPRAVSRTIGETSYQAQARPDGFHPEYSLAAFASFPIHAIEVIRDPEDGTHEDTYDRSLLSGLPVELVDE
jgi:hypothetical protein